jgi:hypothetical protein
MAGGEIACFAAIFYLDTREFFVKPGGSGSGNIFAWYERAKELSAGEEIPSMTVE